MHLDPDPLQREFARAVSAVNPRSAWRDLARIGAFALGLPVPEGGLDLGLSVQIVVSAGLGAALRPVPGYHDTVLAADLLAGLAGPVAAELRAGIAAGSAVVATAGIHSGPCGGLDGDGRLHGLTGVLEDAPWTHLLVRTTRLGNGGGEVLVVCDPDGSGCRSWPVPTLAGPGRRLRWSGASCRAVAGDPAVGPAGPDRGGLPAVAAARVRQAAFLAGLARAALGVAGEHVRRREQFGRRLIEFQTVGHRLAMLVAESDGLDLLVHEAAWRIDTGRPAGVHPPQVLAAAAEHALAATRLAVQLHGARGIVADGQPALAYRLAAVEAVRLGTPESLWREAGRHRLTDPDRWDDESPAVPEPETAAASISG